MFYGHQEGIRNTINDIATDIFDQEFDIPVTDVDIMTEDEEFEWRGQEAMDVRSCQFRHPLGYRPVHILQMEPPSAVTSLAINNDWGLVAAGESERNFSIYFDPTALHLASNKTGNLKPGNLMEANCSF